MFGKEQPKDLSSNETEVIIDEYRARLKEALQKEKDRFREFSKQEAEKVIAAANERANQMVSEAQKEAERLRTSSRNEVNQEITKALDEANKKAEQITREAEQKTKQEAKDRVRKEIEKLLSTTRLEAEGIVAQAKEAARYEQEQMVAKSREEATRLTKEAKEKVLEEAAKESEEIIARARDRALSVTAQAMRLGIKQAEQEIDRLLKEIKRRLEAEVFWFLQEIPQKVSKIIDGTRFELSQKVEGAQSSLADSKPSEGRVTPAGEQDAAKSETGYLSELFSQKGDRTTETAERDDSVYEGVLNLETSNAAGSSQVRFNESLSRLNGVKLVSTTGSYQGKTSKTIYTVALERPLPLLKVLRSIPIVESVSTRNKDIVLKLRQDS